MGIFEAVGRVFGTKSRAVQSSDTTVPKSANFQKSGGPGLKVVFILGPPETKEAQDLMAHAARVENISVDEMWMRFVKDAFFENATDAEAGKSKLINETLTQIVGERVEIDRVFYSESRMRGHVCPALTIDTANIQTPNQDLVTATLSDSAVRNAIAATMGLTFKTEWTFSMTAP